MSSSAVTRLLCIVQNTSLKAIPVLWINMIQDTLGSLALAAEPSGERLLKRKPCGRKKRIISTAIARNIIGQGAYQTAVLLIMLFFVRRNSLGTCLCLTPKLVLGPHILDIEEPDR